MASAGPFDRRNARAFHLHAISSPANDGGNPAEQVDRVARFFGGDPRLRGADLFAVAAGKLRYVSSCDWGHEPLAAPKLYVLTVDKALRLADSLSRHG
jgi:hypothetical protein